VVLGHGVKEEEEEEAIVVLVKVVGFKCLGHEEGGVQMTMVVEDRVK
jgi:hypothetical protein